MPGINVSALSGGDLRRLLKVAHARHDGLLADRLEWEIAARATSGGPHAGPFATLPDDDQDEAVDRMTVSDPEPYAPELTAQEPARATRSVLLVTVGAVAGSLLSASVFWGLGRIDGLPVLGRAQPQPTQTAPEIVPATPFADQTVAVLAPEALPLQTEPIAPAPTVEAATLETPRPAETAPVEVAQAAAVEAPLPAATTPVEVAQKAEPAAKVHKKPAAAKGVNRKRPAKTQLAERGPRPPTLAEWLAKSEPEDPIH